MPTLRPNDIQTKLTREQKEAVGLLSIGTFLEYFDLMLYVHMAVLLNALFFPKTDPHTTQLLSALAFCSTYLLRPFGAIIFGYIGDRFGRKIVVVLTTFIMSASCVFMSMMPTYAQIGILASIVVTIIRMVQGLAATAEARGAELYLTETIRPPYQYVFVTIVTVGSALGTSFALGISSVFTSAIFADFDSAWRGAFIFGAIVALVGTIARTTLKESEEFANKMSMIKMKARHDELSITTEDQYFIDSHTPMRSTSAYYFFIQCARPPCFYFIYIYCGDLLRHEYSFTPAQVIHQNFLVSIADLLGIVGLACLSYKFHPLKILKAKLYLFFIVIITFPFCAHKGPDVILIFQLLASLFVFDHVPATPIFYKHFPVLKRFTYTSMLSAVAKLTTYLLTSFGLVYLTQSLSYYGLLVIFIPIGLMFFISVRHFEKLENNFSFSQ